MKSIRNFLFTSLFLLSSLQRLSYAASSYEFLANQTTFKGAAASGSSGIFAIENTNPSPMGATLLGVGSAANGTYLFNLTDEGNLSLGRFLNIDNSSVNNGLKPDLFFGPSDGANPSGEGIGSNRSGSGENPNGLDIYTNNVKRISITSDGKVGIGTKTPAAALEVNGNALVNGNLTIAGTGGNVPHGCYLKSYAATASADTVITDQCPRGEIVLGGGGSCGIGRMVGSYPTYYSLWQWNLSCAISSANVAISFYMICCKQ